MRKRLTIVVADDAGRGQHLIITKGAFANVLAICTRDRRGRHRGAARRRGARARSRRTFASKGTQGFRVLGAGHAHASRAQGTLHRTTTRRGMCFAGFLLFLDPPKSRRSARRSRDLAARGVARRRSSPATTATWRPTSPTRSGSTRSAMLTGEAIAATAATRRCGTWRRAPMLFAEVDPQQKERIVRALQRTRPRRRLPRRRHQRRAGAARGRRRHLGRQRGRRGARERRRRAAAARPRRAAPRACDDGRRTFANTLKYIAITTSANFGNMVSMALATPLLPFLPLAAKQILLNNFLSDLPVDRDLDRQRRRRRRRASRSAGTSRDIRRFMIVFGLISTVFDLLTFFVLLQRVPRRRSDVPDRVVRGVAAHRARRPAGAAHAPPGLAQRAEPLLLWSDARGRSCWPLRSRTSNPSPRSSASCRCPRRC